MGGQNLFKVEFICFNNFTSFCSAQLESVISFIVLSCPVRSLEDRQLSVNDQIVKTFRLKYLLVLFVLNCYGINYL